MLDTSSHCPGQGRNNSFLPFAKALVLITSCKRESGLKILKRFDSEIFPKHFAIDLELKA